MDLAVVGSLLVGVGAVVGGVVAYLGKRGENAITRFNSVTDQVQEELGRVKDERDTARAELAVLQQQRKDDLIEITRLHIKVINLGGEP
ncbi:hypothetical protein [Streptomyces phaeochromogenes]|uniref:hypothetical protein n=1 Tax=Streptomyces phaeochromogenes TaxID=1923 RepID=UPI002DD7F673|nr:hypothetical protein [Streptomyces phaeochromogenes]WRZ31328.1 hypothetical protein OG931_28085 [Streptomyces phaeochromogenes]